MYVSVLYQGISIDKTIQFLTTVDAKRQRNRDAQAAFRERRTEYVKELERDMKLLQAEVQELRAARSNGADETLMLRYENSFLTRLLIENGKIAPCYLSVSTNLT